MNKLYVINWALPNGYVFDVTHFWTERGLNDKIRQYPDWTFTVTEDNDCHKIVTAK